MDKTTIGQKNRQAEKNISENLCISKNEMYICIVKIRQMDGAQDNSFSGLCVLKYDGYTYKVVEDLDD